MRFSALVPAALCATSLVLAFVCLFAGSQKGFLEDYAVLTLNTSCIGQNIVNAAESSNSELGSLLGNLTGSIELDVQNKVSSYAKDLGLHDWYSAHLMAYCEGCYTPRAIPNHNVSKSDIRKNITACSNRTAMYDFNPQEILQKELHSSGTGIHLSDLDWPDDIWKGFDALRTAAKATFVLYCIAIGFIGLAFISAAVCFFLDGQLSALVNVIVDWLAFAVMGIASAIATVIGAKASDLVNKYGKEIRVGASRGTGFIIITWIATGLLLVASMVWCFDYVVGRRRRVATASEHKYG